MIDGTAKRRELVSYNVAGKTGTADKLVERPLFAVPAERLVRRLRAVAQPVLTVIVMIDSPRAGATPAARSPRRSSSASPTPACGTSA